MSGRVFIMECGRCGRREAATNEGPREWSATIEDGAIVGFICPDCLTAVERIAQEADEATLDYSLDDRGRLTFKPKCGPL